MAKGSTSVSPKQDRIAELAKQQSPPLAFTSLAYRMDIDWLKEAYRRTRKDGAVGVDGVTAAEYEQNLEQNLRALLDRAMSGTYRALPVRRVYIPKGDSQTETRPIGIPTLEDKVLQRAVVMLLEPIYEHDFMDCSYGFRPKRSAHQALQSVWKQTMDIQGGWILEVDIRKFFDCIDHKHLREFFQRRVRDGVLTRLIGKWLKAGVMEDGSISYPESGSPQGGEITPPTKVQNFVLASSAGKKGEVDAVDDADLFGFDLDAVDQGAEDVTARVPVRGFQATLNGGGEVVEASQRFAKRGFFTSLQIDFVALRLKVGQSLAGASHARLKLIACYDAIGIGINQATHRPLGVS